MIQSTLRKVGEHFQVTIPEDEVKRLGLVEGQTVAVQLASANEHKPPTLPAELRDAFEVEFQKGQAGLRYLAEH